MSNIVSIFGEHHSILKYDNGVEAAGGDDHVTDGCVGRGGEGPGPLVEVRCLGHRGWGFWDLLDSDKAREVHGSIVLSS